MAEKHLIEAICKRAKAMPAGERIGKIKKLVSVSAEDGKFIRKTFPELYREAFPSHRSFSSEDERFGSNQPSGLFAKRH